MGQCKLAAITNRLRGSVSFREYICRVSLKGDLWISPRITNWENKKDSSEMTNSKEWTKGDDKTGNC